VDSISRLFLLLHNNGDKPYGAFIPLVCGTFLIYFNEIETAL